MNWNYIDISQLPSPCYLIDCDILKQNLSIMRKHCEKLGIKPLLAVKGFPLALVYNEISEYLIGGSASSLFEAKICERLGKEIHIHAPAYRPDEIEEILIQCDHIVFNSITQWEKYKNILRFKYPTINPGLRINPEYSEIDIDKYNPCLSYSRLGITLNNLSGYNISGINGLHFHVMCDQGAEILSNVIDIIIDKFDNYLRQVSWINLGGGHQIGEQNYNINVLQRPMLRLIQDYNLQVYIEPCESLVTSSGFLVSTVLDIINNKKQIAILDTSAMCHMPDVIEMPYCPDLSFPYTHKNGEFVYYLAGNSCMPGDVIGNYNFIEPLHVGDKVIFSDMGAYTFARENYFNGINHPSIVLYDKKHGYKIVKQFNYEDYANKYC
ncbi:MAG: carboxynorspermidine decarboxylase [Ruminococcus flavefaciens]|nr:carboxynorspermidine decarboxylase [Ruminococcus flavefaciens]